MAPPRTQRSVVTEGVFLSALLVLVVATVPTVFSFASSSSSKQAPTAPPVGSGTTADRQPRTPLLTSLLAATPVLNLALSVFASSLQLLLAPILFVLQLVLALLAPLILVVQTTLHLFIVVPYMVIAGIIALLYPVYMFCATACLVGVMFAFGGSLVQRLVGALLGTQDRSPDTRLHAVPPARRVTYKGQRSL